MGFAVGLGLFRVMGCVWVGVCICPLKVGVGFLWFGLRLVQGWFGVAVGLGLV